MATEIGKLIARFQGDISHFEAATRKVERGFRQTAAQMTAAERAQIRTSEQLQRQRSGALISIWKADERAHAAAERAKTRAAEQAAKAQQRAAEQAARASTRAHEQFAQRFAVSYNAMKTTALAVFAAIGTGAAGLGLIVSRAMSFDVIERGLEVIAGSSTEAQKQLARLKELARLPGLGVREAIQASIALQIGFQSSIKDTSTRVALAEDVIKRFSNAIARTGGGPEIFQRVITQLTQMANAGKVLMTDLRPIIQAAPALGQSLVKAFGTISPEEINALGLSTEEFMRRWVAALAEQPPAVDSAANAWTNFTNAVDQALIKMGKPFLEPLQAGLNVLEPLLDRVGTRAGEIFTRVGQDASAIWANLPTETKAAFDDMLKTVQGVGGSIVKWFTENYPLMLQAATNILNQIAAFWKAHGDTIKKNLAVSMQQIGDVLKLVLNVLKGDWEAAGNNFVQVLLGNGRRLLAITEQNMALIEGAIVKAVPVLGKIAYGVGKAIAEGVWEGIKSSDTAAKVYMWAFELGLAAKNALIIKSPSRVFVGIGADIGAGLVLGLQSKAGEVQQTLADMLDLTASKFQKAPKKPAEKAAKQIADMLHKQADALREIGGEETAIAKMNRLLSDPSVAKRIDERTRAILRQAAAMLDAAQLTRERYAITRPRKALGEGPADEVRERIFNHLAWMTGTRARRVGDEPTADAEDLGGGSFLMRGGTGSERSRFATVQEQVMRERLAMLREQMEGLAFDLMGIFDRALYDGIKGGGMRGLQSLTLGFLDMIQQVILGQLKKALAEALGSAASGGGIVAKILGALVGVGTAAAGGGMGGNSGPVGSGIGNFAKGGFMQPNSWNYVGEEGTELIRAGRQGATVIPNQGNSTKSVTNNINVTWQQPRGATFRQNRSKRELAERIAGLLAT